MFRHRAEPWNKAPGRANVSTPWCRCGRSRLGTRASPGGDVPSHISSSPHPNDELTPFLTPLCPLQAPLRRPPYKSMRFSLARSQRRASWKLLCSPATARACPSPRGFDVGFMTCQTSQTTSAEEFEKVLALDSQNFLPPRTTSESSKSRDLYYIIPIELLWNCQQSFQADFSILKPRTVIGSGSNLGQFDREDINGLRGRSNRRTLGGCRCRN